MQRCRRCRRCRTRDGPDQVDCYAASVYSAHSSNAAPRSVVSWKRTLALDIVPVLLSPCAPASLRCDRARRPGTTSAGRNARTSGPSPSRRFSGLVICPGSRQVVEAAIGATPLSATRSCPPIPPSQQLHDEKQDMRVVTYPAPGDQNRASWIWWSFGQARSRVSCDPFGLVTCRPTWPGVEVLLPDQGIAEGSNESSVCKQKRTLVAAGRKRVVDATDLWPRAGCVQGLELNPIGALGRRRALGPLFACGEVTLHALGPGFDAQDATGAHQDPGQRHDRKPKPASVP